MQLDLSDSGKHVRTRDGRECRIYSLDGDSARPIHGAIKYNDGGYWVCSWAMDGSRTPGHADATDLIPKPVPPRMGECWLNVYASMGGKLYACCYRTKELADADKASDRLACIHVDLVEGRFDS